MCAPEAPDMTAQNTAAASQAATSAEQTALTAEQLAFAKQVYTDGAPDRAAASARAKQVSDAMLTSMDKQNTLADDYAAYQKGTFRPLEQEIVADAAAYDTPERRAAESADVMAKVGTQFDVARGTMGREASARGVDPSSGNFMASMGTMGAVQAAQQAGAGNTAAKTVETIGAAKKMDAASLGRGLPGNQATSASLALNAGNSAVGNAQVPTAVAGAGAQLMNTGYAGAQAGLGSASSGYGSVANMRPAATGGDNSGMWGALGTVAGAALPFIMAASDKNIKENIEPIDEDKALKQVEDTPVSTYNYRPGTVGAADAGTEKTAGPMAQDALKTMGSKVAPKGKKIDLIAMNGITMAAVQALSKKVDRFMAADGVAA